jgi:hypothetical protein
VKTLAGTVSFDFGVSGVSPTTQSVYSLTSTWLQANYSYSVSGSYQIKVTLTLADGVTKNTATFPIQADQSI